RRVRTEDERWLTAGGLSFNLHAIIGGQMAGDPHARMFLIYPEGNWIEITEGTPYVIIGASSYGKPLLDRAWRVDHGLQDALTIGLLAYDATRASAADVGPPLDAVLYRDGTFAMHEHDSPPTNSPLSHSSGPRGSRKASRRRNAAPARCSMLSLRRHRSRVLTERAPVR
ncbi:MAG: hypothetical protein Q8M79_11125, partial [Dehalococcoidia bacterium]|nr:hypothetical protein [Dehalococcoidia bacterium]